MGNSISMPSTFLAAGATPFICFLVPGINIDKCFSSEWIGMWMDKLIWLRSDANNQSEESLAKARRTLAGIFISRHVTETHSTSKGVSHLWDNYCKDTANLSMTSLRTLKNKWYPTFIQSMSPEKSFHFPQNLYFYLPLFFYSGPRPFLAIPFDADPLSPMHWQARQRPLPLPSLPPNLSTTAVRCTELITLSARSQGRSFCR